MLLKTGLAALVLMMASVCAGVADDIAVTGRNITSKWADSVVYIQIVLKVKMSYGGQTETKDSKSSGIGVVVDPSGLVVVPFSAMNPVESGSDEKDGGGEYSQSTEVSSIKVRMPDGIEVPYKVVLRDKDLDLAFIKPIKDLPKPVVAVNLKDAAKADVLDRVLVLNRLDKIGGLAIAATVQRVNAIIEKPRTCYRVSLTSPGSQYGGPVFSLNGKIVGILLIRTVSKSDADDAQMVVVLPADDIDSAVSQVLEETPASAEAESSEVPQAAVEEPKS